MKDVRDLKDLRGEEGDLDGCEELGAEAEEEVVVLVDALPRRAQRHLVQPREERLAAVGPVKRMC